MGVETANLARDFHAVQFGHAHVEHDQIGPQLDGLGDRFPPGARFAADDPSWLALEQQANAHAHDIVIVGDQDADGCVQSTAYPSRGVMFAFA